MSHHKQVFRDVFYSWLPLAVAIIIMSGLIYLALQQNYRHLSNDPQIQIAQDIASALSRGEAQSNAIVPSTPTSEMVPSLSTFVVIYSATGTPIGSSAALDGELPAIAENILVAAKKTGENRVTWQPKPDIKIAAVITSFSNPSESGFVLAGRSLKETDNRIAQLGIISAIGTLVALLLSYLVMWQLVKKNTSHGHHEHTGEHHHTHSA